MSDELKPTTDPPAQQSWLRRLLQRDHKQSTHDTIAAQIGEAAQNVAVGKNIIQIGSLKIPRYLVVIVAMGIGVLVFIGLVNAYRLRVQQWQTGEVLAIVSARTFTATPSPPPTLTSTPTPPRMPEGTFNIAVAELSAIGVDGQPVQSDVARERAVSIANFVSEQADTLTQIIKETVIVWGPDHHIPVVRFDEAETRATNLNANVLIYGDLRQVDEENWKLEPKFYLTEQAIHQAAELAGEHALGRALDYVPTQLSDRGKVNEVLRIRIEALLRLLYGLSLMTDYNAEGYHEAVTVFQDVADNSEWAKANDNSGQEILYLFLGNAYLAEGQLLAEDSAERSERFVNSKAAYLRAIDLAPQYARSYNGLGSVNLLLARGSAAGDECDWAWVLIDDAETAYHKALAAPEAEKPPSGQVDYRAHAGLGRIHFLRGYCASADTQWDAVAEWDSAITAYQVAIEIYSKMQNSLPEVMDIAVYAHTDLGIIALIESEEVGESDNPAEQAEAETLLSQSLVHFQDAYALITQRRSTARTSDSLNHGLGTLPYYLSALCIADKGAVALRVLEQFTSRVPNGDEEREAIVLVMKEGLDDPTFWEECVNDQAQ